MNPNTGSPGNGQAGDVAARDSATGSERIVLGACMIHPTVLDDVRPLIAATDFYIPVHGLIWSTICALAKRGDPYDPEAVHRRFIEEGTAGIVYRTLPATYLHDLMQAVPVIANATWHAHQVRKAMQNRDVSALGNKLHQMAHSNLDPQEKLRMMLDAAQCFDESPCLDEDRRPASLDWKEFFAADLRHAEWEAGKLAARGQQVALVGDGKVGKSLLSLEWAWRAAAGLPFLSDAARSPRRVVYIDGENPHTDIQSRLISLGATPETLGNVAYHSFPPLPPLNTAEGGAALRAMTEGADVVFIDTISRYIAGKENDSDTWLDLYRHSLMPLKAAGVTTVRLDHFGKDQERGSRGSSAKTQDVDTVWELKRTAGGTYRLSRTHTRSGLGEDTFELIRQGECGPRGWEPGKTRHAVATHEEIVSVNENVEVVIQTLDFHKVPDDYGRDRLKEAGGPLGIRMSNELWSEVARVRKARNHLSRTGVPDHDQDSGQDR